MSSRQGPAGTARVARRAHDFPGSNQRYHSPLPPAPFHMAPAAVAVSAVTSCRKAATLPSTPRSADTSSAAATSSAARGGAGGDACVGAGGVQGRLSSCVTWAARGRANPTAQCCKQAVVATQPVRAQQALGRLSCGAHSPPAAASDGKPLAWPRHSLAQALTYREDHVEPAIQVHLVARVKHVAHLHSVARTPLTKSRLRPPLKAASLLGLALASSATAALSTTPGDTMRRPQLFPAGRAPAPPARAWASA
jgi:hypothetical protein